MRFNFQPDGRWSCWTVRLRFSVPAPPTTTAQWQSLLLRWQVSPGAKVQRMGCNADEERCKVRIRPFSAKEATQLAPQDSYQPFLGDGGLSAGSSAKVAPVGGNAPSLRTKYLRPIIAPVDDKVLIFDPPDTNPLSRLYAAGQNTFSHGNRRARDVRYAFDRVFDDKCGQEMVFENTTRPLLDGILNGYNASVFAYGVSGREALPCRAC